MFSGFWRIVFSFDFCKSLLLSDCRVVHEIGGGSARKKVSNLL